MKSYREIVIREIKRNQDGLKMLVERHKDDKQVVLKAVEVDVKVLEIASHRLKYDKDIIKTAVLNNGEAIKFAA